MRLEFSSKLLVWAVHVTTDVPGVIQWKITLLAFCEPRNSSSLADKAEKFINLSAEKKALALSARKKMEREFNVEQIIESYCEVLHNVTTKYYTKSDLSLVGKRNK